MTDKIKNQLELEVIRKAKAWNDADNQLDNFPNSDFYAGRLYLSFWYFKDAINDLLEHEENEL